MTQRKFNYLSENDAREIGQFVQYLHDKSILAPEMFCRKWQEYMGLTDSELDAIISKLREAEDTNG